MAPAGNSITSCSHVPANTLFITGGGGLLGRSIRRLRPSILAPVSNKFDITNPPAMRAFAKPYRRSVRCLIHAAALTSPPAVDADPASALAVNVVGTANVTALCIEYGWRLVYISTDYVFRGDRGGYREDDELHPVNAYAWSKLGGECAVRLHPRSLIVRTSFGAAPFPYPRALVDQITSREEVSVAAAKILRLADSDLLGVIHIGCPGRSVMDYARSVSGGAEFAPLTRADLPFTAPADTSLDCSRYQALFPEPDAGAGS